jgi:hypothetical protein
MKKIVLLLSVVSLVIASCSSDADSLPVIVPLADSVVDTNGILVKKQEYTDTGFPTEIYNYTYSGNKLVKITDQDGGYSNVTYTGDLITKIEHYDNGNGLIANEIFTYTASNKMLTNTYKDFDANIGTKYTYTYNSDGTVSYDYYFGDSTTQTTSNGSYKMFFLNNEVIKMEHYSQTGVLTKTDTFTYDGKNNPFKNITGWAELGYNQGETGSAFQNLVNNNNPNEMYTNFYTYDSNNFPLTEIAKDNSDSSVISTAKYTY